MGVLQNFQKFGYGHGSVKEPPEVPCIVVQAYRTHRSSGRAQNMAVPVPRVLCHRPYRTHRMNALQNVQMFSVG